MRLIMIAIVALLLLAEPIICDPRFAIACVSDL